MDSGFHYSGHDSVSGKTVGFINGVLPVRDTDKNYVPRAVRHFRPARIVMTRGCDTNTDRARFVEAICRTYPDAEIIDRTALSHAKVDLDIDEPLLRHEAGKNTLVFGEHKSAVRFSEEQANCCPNYWHFSPYGFCPYHCAYCYLAGTRGVWFSPTVKVFVNLDEMLSKIDRIARQAERPTAFYLGKLQDGLALDPLTGYSRTLEDGLALDPLTGYSRTLVPFFAEHSYARLVVLTKSADVGNLLGLKPDSNVILSWSLSSESLWRQFEPETPSPTQRLIAMRRCAEAGYRTRAVIMPILPVGPWKDEYSQLVDELIKIPSLERITLGSLCSFPNALRLTEAKLGKDNVIIQPLGKGGQCADGRYRFTPERRIQCYRYLLSVIREHRPGLAVGLCLEDRQVFAKLGLLDSIGKCNCVL